MLLSHALRREGPAVLGFQTGNLWECAGKYAPARGGNRHFSAGGRNFRRYQSGRCVFSQGLLALGL